MICLTELSTNGDLLDIGWRSPTKGVRGEPIDSIAPTCEENVHTR